MTRGLCGWLTALLLAGLCVPAARAADTDLAVNSRLKGRVVDYTANHGANHRLWSRSLYQWRDLYVYLPPNYDRTQQYPVILFFHGFGQDEQIFLNYVGAFDAAICAGKLAPAIIVAPDGSIDGTPCFDKPGSFFLNSNAGPFEDFVLQDVWDFVCAKYSIRCERGAHAIVGVSMGGFTAYNYGMRHRGVFGVVAGLNPPLNLRWADVDLDSRANFDPRRWGWRLMYRNPDELAAKFGSQCLSMYSLIEPVFGWADDALREVACNNPIELILRTRLCNGELAMFVGYGGRDEYNVDAQVDSFLYLCQFKGLGVVVAYDPNGRHNEHTAQGFVPAMLDWLGTQLAPYGPCDVCGPPARVTLNPPRPSMPRYLP
jgi:S-formylglutathione hydrolase FrmB